MSLARDILQFTIGVLIVAIVCDSVVRTFVVPRPAQVTLTRVISLIMRSVFDGFLRFTKTYEQRDRIMALYGPLTLLGFAVTWLALTLLGYMFMFVSVSNESWWEATRTSGSALFTLGFAVPKDGEATILVFTEAAIGLLLIALLIAYLPTIYAAFSRREIVVTELSVRAGTPPLPESLYIRAHRAQLMDRLDSQWRDWEAWFVELEESHTSLPTVNFFRSPNPYRSWLTASGCILDSAAMRLSTIDLPFEPNAGICIRAGYMTLRSIADFFGVPYDPNPEPGDPIAVAREEFLEVYHRMAEAGVPVKADPEQCWRDYAGWRINYDAVLITLGGLLDAPPAPWVTDRSLTAKRHRPPWRHRRSSRPVEPTIR